jgi:hypothetical protein
MKKGQDKQRLLLEEIGTCIRTALQRVQGALIESRRTRQGIIHVSGPAGKLVEAGPSSEPARRLAEERVNDGAAANEALRAQQDDESPTMAENTTEFASLAEEQLIKDWPILDEPDSGGHHRARRWTFLVAAAGILVAAGGSYAMRVGPTRGRASGSSCSASPAVRIPAASVPPGIGAGQGMDKPGAAPSVEQVAGAEPPIAPPVKAGPVAVPADSQATLANVAARETGSQPQRASGATLSAAVAGRQDPPPTPGTAPPTMEGLGARCRKIDAGGKGKPALVLAACRPAVEAEPEAADIMVILARAEIDLGRAAQAQAWAKKALRIKSDLPEAYVFLGGAEQEMGRSAEARAAYRKYLELAPTGRHARELRAVLDSL